MLRKGITLVGGILIGFILVVIPVFVYLQVLLFHWAYNMLAVKLAWPGLGMWESFAAVVLLNMIGGLFRTTVRGGK